MSGHNKWSKIKHKKASSDAKKSKEFSKLSKLITAEAKEADGNVESPGLSAAIDRARKANMPNDNIEKAIKKATDPNTKADERITYELYGPGGSAIVINILTDNRNRTSGEIKHLLSKEGYELSKPGAAIWAFEKKDGELKPTTIIELLDEDKEKLEKLTSKLEDHEDVSQIFTNANL